MLTAAGWWRPGSTPPPAIDVLAEPDLAHYVVGWPAQGDFGVIAEDDGDVGSPATPVGATWCRYFDPTDPGYGFVAPDVPELSIGVVAHRRGEGIGRRLLEELAAEARRRGIARISLSVEPDNPAMALYERVGFVVVGGSGGAVTMVLETAPPEP